MKPEVRAARLRRAEREGSLACQVPGCRTFIRGWTGLDQLTKLRAHYDRVHLVTLTMDAALNLRERMEADQRNAVEAER